MMDTRQNPQLDIQLSRESHLETLTNFASRMEVAMKEMSSALTRAADDMACFYDAHWKKHIYMQLETKSGSMGRKITTTCPMKRLDHKWLGPYTINKVLS